MVTRRLWWAAAGALLVLGACDSPRVGTDGGNDGGADACEGLTLCTTAGTSCDGDSVVTCAANADGCMVATSTACGADQTCDDSGATAECVDDDPCDAIPVAERCDTAGERACDADTLTICTADADGCLVLEETDCAAAAGGACDESGTMPMCVLPVDPCDGIADACTTAGTSCEGNNLVTCAPNAFGCLVETTADCASRAGGTCGGDPAECTFTGDPCDGVTECATAGVSCDGPELVACAEDAFGCMVETRTDCTDVMFGFCDADAATATCSTAATDPCMGETECGTEPTRACSTDDTSIEECSANAFGCFVTETTSCTDTDEVCSDAGGTVACVDPCSLVDVCPSATYCAGAELVTCTADTNGCLVETSRAACAATETCDPSGTAACVTTTCPEAVPGFINCDSGTVNGDTAMGSDVNDGRYGGSPCSNSTSWDGMEQFWRFRNDEATPVAVTIVSTRGTSTEDFDLFVIDGAASCSADTQVCLDGSQGFSATETVEFVATPGQIAHVVYDLYSSATATTDYTLEITCTPIVCGDGVVNGDEECEDGNTTAGDGCSDTCELERGWDCTDAIPAVCTFVCGNGTIDTGAGEECDDGAVAPSDGCSATCGIEAGYGCSGTPSVCFELADNWSCATGTAVAADTSITGEDLDFGGARPSGSGCGGGAGNRVLYYSVTVPASTRVDVMTTRPTAGPDLVLFVQDACSDTGCTASSDTPERIALTNTTAATVTRIVGIRGYNSTTTGTFDVAFAYTAIAANASCAGAAPLGTGVTGVDLSTGGPRPTGTNCGSSAGPVLYYEVTVPADSITTVTATATGTTWDPTLRSVADCSGTCLQHRDASGSANETIALTNLTGTAVTRVIAVGADSTTNWGTFDLSASSASITYAANSTCATATAIDTATPSVTAQNTGGGGASPSGATCESSGSQTLYYAVTVPAGQIATVEVDGASGFDPVAMALDSCGAADCLSGVDNSGDGGSEFVDIDNSAGAAAITRIIAVNDFSASDTGSFEVEASFRIPAPNATCATATSISSATTLTAENTAGGGAYPMGSVCDSGDGNTLYYAISVLAGQTATVTIDGATGFDAYVMELDSCGAADCADTTDSSGGGGVETVVVDNSAGTATVTRIIAVNEYFGTDGTFDLTVAYAP